MLGLEEEMTGLTGFWETEKQRWLSLGDEDEGDARTNQVAFGAGTAQIDKMKKGLLRLYLSHCRSRNVQSRVMRSAQERSSPMGHEETRKGAK